jgi:hypothetical protein
VTTARFDISPFLSARTPLYAQHHASIKPLGVFFVACHLPMNAPHVIVEKVGLQLKKNYQ